ncbi:uncharacterized protein LOC143023485 isoform X2 [Oratosquilla oratoria]|uniref:uncharacterized protein LOC143023485 isoform X2 n=1 Tax=Oratosquilla oratoria TaxID=337810 RepID=UPI003F75B2D5
MQNWTRKSARNIHLIKGRMHSPVIVSEGEGCVLPPQYVLPPHHGLSPSLLALPHSDKEDFSNSTDREELDFRKSMLRMEEELNQLHLHSQRSTPMEAPAGKYLQPQQQQQLQIQQGETSGQQQQYEGSSSPDTPPGGVHVTYRDGQRVPWFEGIIGCLRPVWTIIGKAALSEKQAQTVDDWDIPFEEISDLQWLGSGAQGAVFRGRLKSVWVAVKKVRDIKETDITHLRKLNHPNVVQFKGVCTQAPCYCIIMEYCPFGPLYNLLKDGRDIPPDKVSNWAKQIACGMKYLHEHKIIHRDLKSPNVLIGNNQTVKISDFGTCREWNDVSTRMSFAGTVAWMAPEVIRNEPCSEKVDIWSFGVVLWELLTCEIPYRDVDNSAIIWGVGSNSLRLPIPSSCPDGFKLIVQMCWNSKPRNRPSFKYILMHLDIAAVEILSTPPETYFKTQASWKAEIRQQMATMCSKGNHIPKMEEDLVRRRREELKHAQDIREHYEKKLVIANDLYLELSAAMLQLEQREQELINSSSARREQTAQIHKGKKRIVKPLLKYQERLHRRKVGQNSISSNPTSPEAHTSSPDSPCAVMLTKKSLYTEIGTNNILLSTTRPTSLYVSNKGSASSSSRQNPKTTSVPSSLHTCTPATTKTSSVGSNQQQNYLRHNNRQQQQQVEQQTMGTSSMVPGASSSVIPPVEKAKMRRVRHQRTRSHGGMTSSGTNAPNATSHRHSTNIDRRGYSLSPSQERVPILVDSGTQTDHMDMSETDMSPINTPGPLKVFAPSSLQLHTQTPQKDIEKVITKDGSSCGHTVTETSPNGNTIPERSPCCEHCPRQKYKRFISTDSNDSNKNFAIADPIVAKLSEGRATFTVEETLQILNNNDDDVDILHQLHDKWDAIEKVLSDKKGLPGGYRRSLPTQQSILTSHGEKGIEESFLRSKPFDFTRHKFDERPLPPPQSPPLGLGRSQSQKRSDESPLPPKSIHHQQGNHYLKPEPPKREPETEDEERFSSTDQDLLNRNSEMVASSELDSSHDSFGHEEESVSEIEEEEEDGEESIDGQYQIKRKCFMRRPIPRSKNHRTACMMRSTHSTQSSEGCVSDDEAGPSLTTRTGYYASRTTEKSPGRYKNSHGTPLNKSEEPCDTSDSDDLGPEDDEDEDDEEEDEDISIKTVARQRLGGEHRGDSGDGEETSNGNKCSRVGINVNKHRGIHSDVSVSHPKGDMKRGGKDQGGRGGGSDNSRKQAW